MSQSIQLQPCSLVEDHYQEIHLTVDDDGDKLAVVVDASAAGQRHRCLACSFVIQHDKERRISSAQN